MPDQENSIGSEVLKETLLNLEGKETALVSLDVRYNDKVLNPQSTSNTKHQILNPIADKVLAASSPHALCHSARGDALRC